MAVVVGAPDVYHAVEAAHGEFVPVVGDVGGEVGVDAVGPPEHVVLQRELLYVGLALSLGPQRVAQDAGGGEPERAVPLICPAAGRQLVHRAGHVAALMQGGLKEPLVVLYAVARQVGLHLRQVYVQAEAGHGRVALALGRVEPVVALRLAEAAGYVPYVVAVVAVLGELHGLLAQYQLPVAGVDAVGKFLYLVAGVVDVELAPDLGPRAPQHLGQGVPQHAAAGVAHVHGPSGVGGDELHHYPLPLQLLGAAVVAAGGLHRREHVGVPARREAEVYKSGPGRLRGGEPAALQLQIGHQRVRYLPRRHPQRPGSGHGVVRREVAVVHVLGHLHRAVELRPGGQHPLLGRPRAALAQQRLYALFRFLYQVRHLPRPRLSAL